MKLLCIKSFWDHTVARKRQVGERFTTSAARGAALVRSGCFGEARASANDPKPASPPQPAPPAAGASQPASPPAEPTGNGGVLGADGRAFRSDAHVSDKGRKADMLVRLDALTPGHSFTRGHTKDELAEALRVAAGLGG